MKIQKKVVTNNDGAAFKAKMDKIHRLDQAAGLYSALGAQIKAETAERDSMKGGITELLTEIGVRQESGSIEIETPRFKIQNQKRVSNRLDEAALEAYLKRNPHFEKRIKVTETVTRVDEDAILQLHSEGLLDDVTMQSLFKQNETFALVIKDRQKATP